MSHSHDHSEGLGSRALLFAIAINLLLTVIEWVGGYVSGSLALMADALHNFGDAVALWIAWFAQRISMRPRDNRRTFGYRRAETIAALINLVTLVIIGLYFLGEAVHRYFNPEPIGGWIVVWVALAALAIDAATAALLFRQRDSSLNMKAAFLHNVQDALASIAVIIAGICILLWNFAFADLFVTILIAGYILTTSVPLLKQTIHILMEGMPEHIELEKVIAEVEAIESVENIHHIHIWQPDEHKIAMDAHVVIANSLHMPEVKKNIKALLKEKFDITRTTIEFEMPYEHGDEKFYVEEGGRWHPDE